MRTWSRRAARAEAEISGPKACASAEWAGAALLSADYAPAGKGGTYGMFTPR